MNIWIKLSYIRILIICNKFHWKKRKKTNSDRKKQNERKIRKWKERKKQNKVKKRTEKKKKIKYISDYENYP